MVVETPAEQVMERAVQKARILARQLYGNEDLAANPSELRAYFTDLCREFRRDGAIEQAKESVRDFKWPEGALNRDSDDLSRLDSIEELIRLRQADLRPFVLNEGNVRSWYAEDPEFHKLLDLAQHGARVETGPNFVRRSSPPPLRYLHTQLGNVWPAYAYDMWEQNLAIILKDDQISAATRSKLHYVHAHWYGQSGKERGRCLIDPSNAEDPAHPQHA